MFQTVLILSCAFLLALGVSFALHRSDAAHYRYGPLDPLIDGWPLGLTAFDFLLALAVTGRPWLSLILMCGGSSLLWAVNRLKQGYFHEPVVLHDLTLVGQVARYPRFYLPYLFPKPVVLVELAVAVGLAVLWGWETPLGTSWRLGAAGLCLGTTVAAVVGWRWLAGPRGRRAALGLLARYRPSLEPTDDLRRLGLLASMFLHGLWHAQVRARDGQPGLPDLETGRRVSPWPVLTRRERAPHVVLVQAESFFDIRRHLPRVPDTVLSGYDRLRAAGQGGSFLVPTHGAYTMRTECSVLTGLGLPQLGTDAFNPYVTASRGPVWSLAREFSQAGYEAVCVHPFPATFFNRHRVMPNLGFAAFHDLSAFADAPRTPYVTDAALADQVLDLLATSNRPLFVFAITIEAHGPWTADRTPLTAGTNLDRYLWYLARTDAMFTDLARGLAGLDRPAVLAGYGDHVAALPGVGPRGLAQPTATDWFVWTTGQGGTGPDRMLAPEALGALVLEATART